MADTELKIRVSAHLSDAKAAMGELVRQFAQLVQGGQQLGATATAGFARMEAQAERAAAASREVATAAQRIGDAIDKMAQKARQPIPVPKLPAPPKAPLGEGVADQTAIARAALKQQLADLEASHRAGLTETKAYYEQRAALQRAGLERELSAAKAAYAAATTQEARNRATTQASILQKQLEAVRVQLPAAKAPRAELTAGTADQSAVQRAALKEQLATLEASHKAGLTDERAYWAQRQQIQRQALEVELKIARAAHAAATTQQARDRASTQVGILQASLKNAQANFSAQKAAGGGGGGLDMAGILGKAKGAAIALGATLATLGTAKAFLALADQSKTLEARLRLATGSAEEFTAANARLYEMAQRTRTDLAQVVDLYARFSNSTKDLGVSQGELLRVTETVSKAIKLSGGSAESANAAIIQLGQGLASGTLRGEELNSVLEQSPRLAQAIAAGMGKSIGELRKLGAEGKITSEQLLNALASQSTKIDAEFKKLPHTVDGAMTVIGNALVRVAGEFDRATGLSDTFARTLEATAPLIEKAGSAISAAAAAFVASAKASFDQLGQSARDMNRDLEKELNRGDGWFDDYADKMQEGVNGVAAGTIPTVVAALRTAGEAIRAGIRLEAAQNQLMVDAVLQGGEAAARNMTARVSLLQSDVLRSSTQIAADMLRATEAGSAAARQVIDAKAEAERLMAEQATIGERLGKVKSAGGAVDRRDVERDALRQKLDDLKRSYDQALIATDAYYRERVALQLRALNLEIEQERAAAAKATTADARSKALTNIAVLEGKRVEIVKAAGNEIYDAEVETTKQLQELRRQAAEEDGKLVQARHAELVAQYADLRKRLATDGNTQGVQLVDRAIDKGTAKAGLDQLSVEIDKVSAAFDRIEEGAANAVLTGTLTSAQAFQRVREAAREAIPQLEAMREQLIATGDKSKEAADKVAQLDARIAQLKVRTQSGLQKALADLESEIGRLSTSFASGATSAFADNLSTFFQDIITGSKSAGDALRDFAKNFARAILQMITQLLALKVAKSILGGGVFGGTGLLGLFGGGSTGGAAVKHAGGLVGAPGPSRTVPLSAFYGAPRLHTGGYLRSDEVPTILQRGEEVLSRNDPRNVRNQGASGPGVVQVVLHPDHNHRTMRDWLEGELARVAATS